MLGPRLSPCTVGGEVCAPLLMGELLVVSTHGGGDCRGATFLHGWTAIKPDAPLLLQGPRKIDLISTVQNRHLNAYLTRIF